MREEEEAERDGWREGEQMTEYGTTRVNLWCLQARRSREGSSLKSWIQAESSSNFVLLFFYFLVLHLSLYFSFFLSSCHVLYHLYHPIFQVLDPPFSICVHVPLSIKIYITFLFRGVKTNNPSISSPVL